MAKSFEEDWGSSNGSSEPRREADRMAKSFEEDWGSSDGSSEPRRETNPPVSDENPEKAIGRTMAQIAGVKERHPAVTARKGPIVCIGHGRSTLWRELKEFLVERLHLTVDEFNSVSTAGISITERLAEMLDSAVFAFLVMTAEDEQTDGRLRARQNVVHEAGLFQGRLGFKKAIILLEDGCEEFSNVYGLGQIRFPRGKIGAEYEEYAESSNVKGLSLPANKR